MLDQNFVKNRYHFTPSKNYNCFYLWIGPNFTSSYYEIELYDSADKLVIRLSMWSKDGLAVDRIHRDVYAEKAGGY